MEPVKIEARHLDTDVRFPRSSDDGQSKLNEKNNKTCYEKKYSDQNPLKIYSKSTQNPLKIHLKIHSKPTTPILFFRTNLCRTEQRSPFSISLWYS